ncbi:MAG: hypothetical protein JXQ85_00130 [Cognatishimia sp.]|uniref:GumC family protein n=1 Tax=Cognatishimia sp. TaxID=2211648 RepID=UPI003B8ABFDE
MAAPRRVLIEPDVADALEVFRAIWRRRWHVLACGFFIGLAFFSIAARQAKVYTADATMLLDPRGQQIVSEQIQVVDDLQLTTATLASAVAVLRSESLLGEVIAENGMEAFANIQPKPRNYGVLGRTLDTIKSIIGRRSLDPNLEVVSEKERRLAHVSFSLLQGIDAQRIGNSYVIKLQVSSVDPVVSALVANGLVQAFMAQQLTERKLVAKAAEDWLAAQVERQRSDLLQAEIAIQQFMENWIEEDGMTGSVLEQQIAELNRQRAISRADIAAQAARLSQIESHRTRAGDEAVAETQPTEVFRNLRIKAQTLSDESEKLAAVFGANHPKRLALQTDLRLVHDEITLEVDTLLQSHRNELEMLNLREESLANDVSELEAGRVTASRAMLELRQLEADSQIIRHSYETLSARLENVRAQAEIQRSEARVMTYAQIPTGPSAPRPKLMGLFGATIGTSVGFLVVLVLEAFGPGFSNAKELEKATGLRVLTSLPELRNKNLKSRNGAMQATDHLWFDRLFRLRATLDRTSSGHCQKLLISAAAPGDGQAKLVLELARLAQSAGHRTLVVSLGDRRSQIQAIHSKQAASNNFAGSQRGHLNLTTLDLKELHLSPDEIKARIETFEEHYDYVIFDAPSVQARVDAVVLAPHVAQFLMVVQCRKTLRQSVYSALDALGDVGVLPTGLVLTEVPSGTDPTFSTQ